MSILLVILGGINVICEITYCLPNITIKLFILGTRRLLTQETRALRPFSKAYPKSSQGYFQVGKEVGSAMID